MTEAEFRRMRKRAGVCRDCGKQDAYTLGGRTYCFDCAEKQMLAKRKARENPEKREKMLESHRQMQNRYEEEHRCKLCGKPLSESYHYKRCVRCRKRQARAVKKSREKKYGIPNIRGENGICYMCNKYPVMQGKRVCKKCYEYRLPIALSNLKKTRINHPWRLSWQVK